MCSISSVNLIVALGSVEEADIKIHEEDVVNETKDTKTQRPKRKQK